MKSFLRAIAVGAAASLLVASSGLSSDALARVRSSTTRAFDGLWSVSIVTNFGDCSRGYRYPLRILDGRVTKADDDPNYQVAGAVGRNGAIGVTIAGGGQSASGTGRLSRDYGQGVWSTSTGRCSGVWTAERRG